MQDVSGNLVALFVPLGFFAVIFGVLYIVVQQRSRTQAQRLELHGKLLDRIGSAREFGEFLSSDAGERFLQALAPSQPRNRIWMSIRIGTFAIAFAVVLLAANFWRLLGSEGQDLQVFGFLVLAFGIAALVSAALSHLAARRMGLDVPPEDRLPLAR